MQRGLFFTTMRNHRPVYIPPSSTPVTAQPMTKETPLVTHTHSKPNITNNKESKNIPVVKQTPSLHNNITRSNEATFSVSAMFGVRSGGGCGTCGH
jgi:hypothetical protein